MSKAFAALLTDELPLGAGRRSVDVEWEALLARPDADPLPPEPANPRPDVALVAAIVRRLARGVGPATPSASSAAPESDHAAIG